MNLNTQEEITKRTQKEIMARIQRVAKDDVMGFQIEDLMSYLSPENAEKVFVKVYGKSPKRDLKKLHEPCTTHPVDKIKEYMPFAWEKANNRKGISAYRTMMHMKSWLWLDGDNKLSKQMDNYTDYGKPQLRVICEKYGIDWTPLDENDEEDE